VKAGRRHALSATRRLAWWGAGACLVGLGIALGLWQWERADDKRDYLARLEAAPHLVMPTSVPPEGATLMLTGEYLADQTLFLDNRTHAGRLGVAALTPFRDANGRLWLVQRGFLETGPSRATPTLDTPRGRVTLEGRWQPAGASAPRFGPNREGQRLQGIDLDAWSLAPDFAYAGWLHLAQGPGHLTSWWQPSVMPPSRHLGYALQWWGLSLVALIFTLVGARGVARRPAAHAPSSKESCR